MKKMNLLIDKCDRCPHSIVELYSEDKGPSDWENVCRKTNRLIENAIAIPEWCPLEDA